MLSRTRVLIAVALCFVFATPVLVAQASEDIFASGGVTSTSGASVSFAVTRGTTVVLQSQTCNFHYRCCTSSTCTAVQTDLYVSQYQAWPVPLTSDRTYCAVACDGTTTGVVYPYNMVVP